MAISGLFLGESTKHAGSVKDRMNNISPQSSAGKVFVRSLSEQSGGDAKRESVLFDLPSVKDIQQS